MPKTKNKHGRGVPSPGPVADTVKTTTCYMCACRCGVRVHLTEGRLRYIEGNPEHPLNKGVICAKGSSGIMKQVSPARLTRPLKRKTGAERGAGEFEPISWDEAFAMLEQRLAGIRATDPKKFALFTGRDQMQALTGLFARQFGTPNYAAHGGFCSVNMAAGMIYSVGGSFWEFGGPDLDRAKLFVMIGTAEDHHSNPMKIALATSSARAAASSRSTPCAPAIRRSPTSGFRSAPAPTAHCSWRCCTNCSRKAWSTGPSCSGSPMLRNW